MLLIWICIVHHSADVSQLVPGRCNDVAPVVAEQRATERVMIDHEAPLEGEGGDIVQQGFHLCMGKEGFDRCIDTATSGFFLLVEDAQKGLEEILGIFDLRLGGWRLLFFF